MNERGERKRVCVNCRRCLRVKEKRGINTYCEIDGHYIGYVECFDNWCRHWAKDKWMVGEENEED